MRRNVRVVEDDRPIAAAKLDRPPLPRRDIEFGIAGDRKAIRTHSRFPSQSVANLGTCRQDMVEQRRSEEHTSELQSLMRTSYAVFCLKKKKTQNIDQQTSIQ